MSTTHTVPLPQGHDIRVTISEDEYVPAELDADHWEHRSYRVTITYQGRVMRVTYRQGMAHRAGDVDPREVLWSIASDAIASDQSFANFCNDFGYDEDTAEARRIYRACDEHFKRISRVFKGDARKFYDMTNGWEL